MTEFTVKEVTKCRVVIFLTKHSAKHISYEIFNIIKIALLWTAKCVLNKEWSLQTHHVDSTLKRRGSGRFHVVSTWNTRGVFVGINFEYSNFNIENYSVSVDVKLLLTRMLANNWNKLVCKFYITVRLFHTRDLSSACTAAWGIFLREGVMAVLAPRSGGYFITWLCVGPCCGASLALPKHWIN